MARRGRSWARPCHRSFGGDRLLICAHMCTPDRSVCTPDHSAGRLGGGVHARVSCCAKVQSRTISLFLFRLFDLVAVLPVWHHACSAAVASCCSNSAWCLGQVVTLAQKRRCRSEMMQKCHDGTRGSPSKMNETKQKQMTRKPKSRSVRKTLSLGF